MFPFTTHQQSDICLPVGHTPAGAYIVVLSTISLLNFLKSSDFCHDSISLYVSFRSHIQYSHPTQPRFDIQPRFHIEWSISGLKVLSYVLCRHQSTCRQTIALNTRTITIFLIYSSQTPPQLWSLSIINEVLIQ